MENGSLGSLQMDTHTWGGGGGASMFGSLGMCALHGRGYEIFNLQKKVFNFTLNRVAI